MALIYGFVVNFKTLHRFDDGLDDRPNPVT